MERDDVLSQLQQMCTTGMYDELERFVLHPYNGPRQAGAIIAISAFEIDYRDWWLDPLMEAFQQLDTELLKEVLVKHQQTSTVARGIHYPAVSSDTPFQKFMSQNRTQLLYKWADLADGDLSAAVRSAMSFHDGRYHAFEAFKDVCAISIKRGLTSHPFSSFHLLSGRERDIIAALLHASATSKEVAAKVFLIGDAAQLSDEMTDYLITYPSHARALSDYMLEGTKISSEVDLGHFQEWVSVSSAVRSGAL